MAEKDIITKFSDNVISGQVTCDRGVYTISGFVHWGYRDNIEIYYRAAEPADLRLSIKGSALPWPNPRHAFGPVNSGKVSINEDGHFTVKLINPNSYYKNDDIMKGVGHGKILVEPIAYLTTKIGDQSKIYEVDLGPGLPLRSLTNYPGKRVRSTGRNTPSYIY